MHADWIIYVSLVSTFKENTRVDVSNYPEACNIIKKEALAQLFSGEFCEISKNTFFTEHLQTTASVRDETMRQRAFPWCFKISYAFFKRNFIFTDWTKWKRKTYQ